MSAPDRPDTTPAQGRSPVVTVLMTVAGIILLLPGLCSLATIVILWGEPGGGFDDAGLVLLWVVCLAISVGGILLIRRTWRPRPS